MPLTLSKITLPRIAQAYIDICNNLVDGATKAFKKLELAGQSPRLRAGRAAAITMPLSIVLRNGGKYAHAMLDRMGKPVRPLIALGGALTGGIFAGKALFALWSTTLASAALHSLMPLAFIGAAMGGILAMPAAAALSVVSFATAVGAVTAALSTIPAAMNIHVGLARSADAFRGRNYIYDVPPAPEAPGPATAVAAPVGETFNAEAAVTLGGDISFKKVRLNFANKPPASSLQK